MPRFLLKFLDSPPGETNSLEFSAGDAGIALQVANEDRNCRSAELWSNGRPLCTIRRPDAQAELWQIGPLLK